MAEPDDAAIAGVCEFTGLDPYFDRELVIAALKDKSGSIEAVVAAFYDDEARFRKTYVWDESSFLGDRDGVNDNPQLPTFNIQAPDEGSVIHGVSPSTLHPSAPSRPPSRTRSRSESPLSKLTDWTAHNVAGAPTSRAQEDTELQRALAESAAMSGLHSPQESGITTNEVATNLPFFGPANREAYDPDQWAMVRTTAEPQEPSPSGRKRTPGTPAFLRYRQPQRNAYLLNAIITILHAIPAARNALLRCGPPSPTYGQNSEWWKGSFIQPAGDGVEAASPALDDGPLPAVSAQPAVSSARDFVEEVHRLIAFLDSTDRAYGTADNLAETELVRGLSGGSPGFDLDCAFFQILRESDVPDVNAALFTEVEVAKVQDVDHCVASDCYAILDIKADCEQLEGGLLNLYNAMDTIYWEDLSGLPPESFEESKMAMISRLGQVQIYRINIDNCQQPLEVPEVVYCDRYMAENRHVALQVQLRLHGICRVLQESEIVRRKIVHYIDKVDNIRRDKSTLSEQALNFDLQKLWQLRAAMFWERHEESRGTPSEFDFCLADVENAEPTTPKETMVYKAIQAEMAVHRKQLIDTNKKLAKLNAERVALRALLDRLRKRNTEPASAENWDPTHRFRLRGVIISSDTFYLCRREETPSQDDGLDKIDQWWKISYDTGELDLVTVAKTTIEAARDAAGKSTTSSILIYGSDAALEADAEPLSDALRTFVRFDNRFFKQELLEETPRERKRMPAEDPTSPSKRQQRSNSIDSLASNRASIGEYSDRDMDDVPLLDKQFAIDEGFDETFDESFGGGFHKDYVEERFAGSSNSGSESAKARDPAQEGFLGTEMVQLAISHSGGSSKTAVKDTQSPHPDDSSSNQTDGSGNSGSDDSIELRAPVQRPGEKLEAQNEIQLMADWDNPEGRYIGLPTASKGS
ncbi:ubiquitin interaction motif protein [Niveomyces insectorum RCEF 264]|uniref:Ubiquitin interaction motif protein n=1 Tax=Niveomyces insectorum RCEF 264 TaxID=1081102 RepID=A0A167RUH5_9HYPO|nr:ubiquitin interaction motif protein [Niveomyces insectorum RCEF 264]